MAIYAGQPDALVLLGSALAVFVAALLVMRGAGFGGSGPVARPLVDLAVATVTGAALGAPLLLPGAQLLATSLRGAKGGSQALPPPDLMYVLLPGLRRLPLGDLVGPRSSPHRRLCGGHRGGAGRAGRGGPRCADDGRRPEVVAVGAVVVVTAALVLLPPLALGSVQWHRALLPHGLRHRRTGRRRRRRPGPAHSQRFTRSLVAGASAAALVLLALDLRLRAGTAARRRGRHPGPELHLAAPPRPPSAWWWWPPWSWHAGGPAPTPADGQAPTRPCARARRARRRTAARGGGGGGPPGVRDGVPRGFGHLVVVLEPGYRAHSGRDGAQDVVGSSLGRLGTSVCFTRSAGHRARGQRGLGLPGVRRLRPAAPAEHDTSGDPTREPRAAGAHGAIVPFSVFCPAVTSAQIARRFGIGLRPRAGRGAGPGGFVLVDRIGGEDLYRVRSRRRHPRPRRARDGPAGGRRAYAGAVAAPRPRHVAPRDPAPRPAVLRLRLTDVPGWSATVDGKPLPLQRYAA